MIGEVQTCICWYHYYVFERYNGRELFLFFPRDSITVSRKKYLRTKRIKNNYCCHRQNHRTGPVYTYAVKWGLAVPRCTVAVRWAIIFLRDRYVGVTDCEPECAKLLQLVLLGYCTLQENIRFFVSIHISTSTFPLWNILMKISD